MMNPCIVFIVLVTHDVIMAGERILILRADSCMAIFSFSYEVSLSVYVQMRPFVVGFLSSFASHRLSLMGTCAWASEDASENVGALMCVCCLFL